MLAVEQLRILNDPKVDIDIKIEITNKADIIDMYLIKLMQRFNEKIDYEKYYLSYSGGKDSHLLYWFIKEILQDNKIKIVGINTYMEHHEIRDRILKNSDIVLYPKLKPMQIKEKYGIPCFSKLQDEYISRYQNGSRAKSTLDFIDGNNSTKFKLNKKAKELLKENKLHKISNKCCKVLKKDTAHKFQKETGLIEILGIRSDEGALRSSKYKSCLTKTKKFTPLWDMTDEIESEIYKRYNIEIPEVYNHIERTGCMGCPYGSYRHRTEKELKLLNENQKKFVCEYFKESYEVLGINTQIQTTIFDFIGENNE